MRSDGAVIATNVKGIALESVIREQPANDLLALIQEAAAGNKITSRTMTIAGRRGPMVLDVSVIPQVARDGLVVLINDLTVERNLRSALAISRQRYKDMVELSGDFYWEVGPDGLFVFASSGGAFGYTTHEIVGRASYELLWESNASDKDPFRGADAVSDFPIGLRGADGTMVAVTLSSRPIVDDSGTVVGVRGVCVERVASEKVGG